jgi:hypothetical protein
LSRNASQAQKDTCHQEQQPGKLLGSRLGVHGLSDPLSSARDLAVKCDVGNNQVTAAGVRVIEIDGSFHSLAARRSEMRLL